MTSKGWFLFVVIQLFIVNGMTLPWFFSGVPHDTGTVIVRSVYIAAGWLVIFMGIIMSLRCRKQEKAGRRFRKMPDEDSDPLFDLNEWRTIPSFPDYEVNRKGEVWFVEEGYMLTPRRGQGQDWYDMYTDEGRCHHLKPSTSLIEEAFTG